MPGEKQMETPFYEDVPSNINNGLWLKKKGTMTLDFGVSKAKKNVLSTPDVQMLKLASPELEKMIINQQGNICTTPTPTQFICPKNVTEEQSAFAQGFVEALQSLHETGHNDVNNGVMSQQDIQNALQQVQAVGQQQGVLETTLSSVTQDQHPVSSTTITNLSCAATTCYNPTLNTSDTILPPGSTVSLPVYSSTAYTTSVSSYSSSSPETIDSVAMTGWANEHSTHHIEAVPMALTRIKQEPIGIQEPPQTVPVFHAIASAQGLDLSPIDMDTQERIKSERKRLRNRIAASKCRKRKLERISRLEDKVRELKNQNTDLQDAATKLREQVCQLKEGVMEHVKCGCQVMLAQQLAF